MKTEATKLGIYPFRIRKQKQLYKLNQWDNKEARKRPMCNQINSNKAGTADHQEKEFGGF